MACISRGSMQLTSQRWLLVITPPEDYRKQMADLHKQHAVLQQEKMGGVASARVVKLTPSADGRQTNVTLRVNYRNQTHEEVLLSFVWVKDRWRLR